MLLLSVQPIPSVSFQSQKYSKNKPEKSFIMRSFPSLDFWKLCIEIVLNYEQTVCIYVCGMYTHILSGVDKITHAEVVARSSGGRKSVLTWRTTCDVGALATASADAKPVGSWSWSCTVHHKQMFNTNHRHKWNL